MFKRFVEGASVICLVLALAAPALGGAYINDGNLVAYDANGRAIHNTFYKCEGDSVLFSYGTEGPVVCVADTCGPDISINPTGMPGWLLVTFPEEATTLTAWFKFFESVDGRDHSYAAGDWVPVYLGASEREVAFNVGLWDSCHVVVVGSAYGMMSAYWRVELISD